MATRGPDAQTDTASFVLLGDQPHRASSDPLEFDGMATGLASLIHGSSISTPLTVGIRAPWGMGKSTLMYKLQRRLQDKDTKTVWFNAWTFEGQDVLEGLVKSVLEQLDPNLLRRVLRNKKLRATLRAVVTIVAGWLRVGNAVDRLWGAISADPRARNQLQQVLEQAMEEWLATVPGPTGKHLIAIFIDDLDRCSPENVFHVFEAIKLYLHAPGFVFVIGFDPGIVSESILQQKKYSTRITSGQYLEKIIQIDYNIPRPNEQQISRLFAEYVAGSGTGRLLREAEGQLIIDGSNRNPRRIKRFINRFVLEHALEKDSATYPPEILIKALMLQMYFGDFSNLFAEGMRKNPVDEFTDYLEAQALLRGESLDNPKLAEVMQFYDLVVPEAQAGIEAARGNLDESVPEEFRRLAKNRDFAALVESLDGNAKELIAQRILRKRAAGEFLDEAAEEAVRPSGGVAADLTPLRILWVDDKPEDNTSAIERIQQMGATVETVTDGEVAGKFLASRSGWANVVISDVQREGSKEAGFDDAAMFKSNKLFDGPIVFYTGRVTGRRRKRADELSAWITSSRQELFEQLQALSYRFAPPEGKIRPVSAS
jgi:CheY-like chemotaxis protein